MIYEWFLWVEGVVGAGARGPCGYFTLFQKRGFLPFEYAQARLFDL